jgi:ABC-type sugar transport system permease subunit
VAHSRALKGALYPSPAVVFVLAFFVVPLALVGQMSASDWPLLQGWQGNNLPDNYTAATDDRLFWPAVWFTLKYTGIVVVALLVLAMVMALLVQARRRGVGSSGRRTSCRSPSGWRRLRCCSGASTARRLARSTRSWSDSG